MTPGRISRFIQLLIGSVLLSYSAMVVAAGSKPMIEPVFTRYARTYQVPTLDFRVEYFKDKPVEEATDFDGHTLFLDFTWPINERSQLEIFLPLYTSGEGDFFVPGTRVDGLPIDIEGYNGIRDFFSLIYERRFSWLEELSGVHVAWLAGFGRSMDPLEVHSGDRFLDRFSHEGYNFQLGLKFDDDIRNGDMTLLGNLRLIMYRDTDDISLSDNGPDFEILLATGAVMFNRYGRFTPVLEAIFEADFNDYTAFSMAPEMIYTITDSFDVKLAVPFRLTSDGQKYATNLELTYRF